MQKTMLQSLVLTVSVAAIVGFFPTVGESKPGEFVINYSAPATVDGPVIRIYDLPKDEDIQKCLKNTSMTTKKGGGSITIQTNPNGYESEGRPFTGRGGGYCSSNNAEHWCGVELEWWNEKLKQYVYWRDALPCDNPQSISAADAEYGRATHDFRWPKPRKPECWTCTSDAACRMADMSQCSNGCCE